MDKEEIEKEALSGTLSIYKAPGQAYWRAREISMLASLRRQLGFERPILEIGCGDGQLTGMVFDEVDDGIDINPRVIERCRKQQQSWHRRV